MSAFAATSALPLQRFPDGPLAVRPCRRRPPIAVDLLPQPANPVHRRVRWAQKIPISAVGNNLSGLLRLAAPG
jgi:hypothetical protein